MWVTEIWVIQKKGIGFDSVQEFLRYWWDYKGIAYKILDIIKLKFKPDFQLID